MAQIAIINNQLQNSGQTDASTAALLDQRDQYINQLSQLMDIRVHHQQSEPGDRLHQFRRAAGRHRGGAADLQCAGHGDAQHAVQCEPDPEQCRHDLHQFPAWRQLRLGRHQVDPLRQDRRLSELRDKTLVQAQAQIDQFAASMSSALSDKTTAGTAASASRRQAGFDLDLAGMKPGNVITSPTRTPPPASRTIFRSCASTIRRAAAGNNATLDPNDEVVGVDFSGGMASVVSQLNAALGTTANLQFSNPAGLHRCACWTTAREPLQRHRGFGDDDDVLAHQRQSAAPAVHRYGAPYTGAITAGGFAADGPRRPHQRQYRAARRSLSHHRLFDQSADRRRRHDAVGFHPVAATRTIPIAIRRRPASAPPARRSPARC